MSHALDEAARKGCASSSDPCLDSHSDPYSYTSIFIFVFTHSQAHSFRFFRAQLRLSLIGRRHFNTRLQYPVQHVDNDMAQLHHCTPSPILSCSPCPDVDLDWKSFGAVAKQKATLMHRRQPSPPRGVTNLTTTTMRMTLLPSDTRGCCPWYCHRGCVSLYVYSVHCKKIYIDWSGCSLNCKTSWCYISFCFCFFLVFSVTKFVTLYSVSNIESWRIRKLFEI